MASLAELIGQGEIGRLSWHVVRGYGRTEMSYAIRQRHPGTSEVTIGAIIDRARSSVAAANLLAGADGSARVAAGAYPRGNVGQSGFQATVYISFRDPVSGVVGSRTVITYSATNPTRGEIEVMAADRLAEMINSDAGSARKNEVGSGVQITGYQIVALSRG